MRILIIIIFLSSFVACSTKQQVLQAAKQNIKELTSDKFHGRGYKHNGVKIAENFIINQYIEIGLIPVYPNYQQEVIFPINIIESSQLKINNINKEFGADYLIAPNSESDEISASLFYIPDNLFDFSMQDGKETFRLLSLNKDNIPLLDFRNATDSLKQKMFAFSNYLDQEKNHYNFPAIVHVHDKLIHGVSSHQDNFNHVFLTEKPEEGSKLDLKIEAELNKNFLSHNIVGKIKGTKSDSAIFVMAHYDHLGQVNQTIFRGANDNASGMSMLLELAKYFKSHPPEIDVYFYAMTGEEVGLKGAFKAAKNLPLPKEKIRFIVNLDMVGTGDDGIQVVNSSIYTNEYNLLKEINQEQKFLKQIKLRGAACNSDHCPFHQLEVPSFFIYTLGGISEYHNPLDKPETLPLTEYYNLYQLLIHFIKKL